MKFGVREIANVVFKAKNAMTIGGKNFAVGQPVFYIDTAKTSTIEGAATTVYATGGRGNARLIAWEGQKTLTFTVEDALLSPISFSMLSGAGLFKGAANEKVHFHQTSRAIIGSTGVIDLVDALEVGEEIDGTAPLYIMKVDAEGDLTGEIISTTDTTNIQTIAVDSSDKTKIKITAKESGTLPTGAVLVDYYVIKNANKVSELQIDMEHFAGFYYVEADTLFRAQNGKDLPANLTLPNVKIQSNFTFAMAATGDPSTFSFTMDAFPGFTYFDKTKKVLCAIQIVDDGIGANDTLRTVFPHPAAFAVGETEDPSKGDSIPGATEP